jgi:hypothetical protein
MVIVPVCSDNELDGLRNIETHFGKIGEGG